VSHKRHLRESAIFTQRYVVTPAEEQAVIIGIRDYNRLIERLNGCKPSGWADLWLAGASAGVAVLISTLVGALTVPTALSGTRDALWAITRRWPDHAAPMPRGVLHSTFQP